MSDTALTRRTLLRGIAVAALAGSLPEADAQHVHHEAAAQAAKTGTFHAEALNEHQFATLRALADLIIPPDEKSPGGAAGGTAEFVDILARHSKRMLKVYTEGLAWMDSHMKEYGANSFLAAQPADQRRLLDRIAFRHNKTPELAPGITFFAFLRRMTVDAYFTSPQGISYLGYMGNKGQTKFEVPADVLKYAVSRSPFARETS